MIMLHKMLLHNLMKLNLIWGWCGLSISRASISTYVHLEQTVTLMCENSQRNNKLYNVIWKHNGSEICSRIYNTCTNRNYGFIAVADDTRNYLTIKNVKPDSYGMYECGICSAFHVCDYFIQHVRKYVDTICQNKSDIAIIIINKDSDNSFVERSLTFVLSILHLFDMKKIRLGVHMINNSRDIDRPLTYYNATAVFESVLEKNLGDSSQKWPLDKMFGDSSLDIPKICLVLSQSNNQSNKYKCGHHVNKQVDLVFYQGEITISDLSEKFTDNDDITQVAEYLCTYMKSYTRPIITPSTTTVMTSTKMIDLNSSVSDSSETTLMITAQNLTTVPIPMVSIEEFIFWNYITVSIVMVILLLWVWYMCSLRDTKICMKVCCNETVSYSRQRFTESYMMT
ncbi:putative immunoglobulin-like domain containing protein [Namao virus]|nr:putative immunoglobulin-like domain containing protein [Namao virus]